MTPYRPRAGVVPGPGPVSLFTVLVRASVPCLVFLFLPVPTPVIPHSPPLTRLRITAKGVTSPLALIPCSLASWCFRVLPAGQSVHSSSSGWYPRLTLNATQRPTHRLGTQVIKARYELMKTKRSLGLGVAVRAEIITPLVLARSLRLVAPALGVAQSTVLARRRSCVTRTSRSELHLRGRTGRGDHFSQVGLKFAVVTRGQPGSIVPLHEDSIAHSIHLS